MLPDYLVVHSTSLDDHAGRRHVLVGHNCAWQPSILPIALLTKAHSILARTLSHTCRTTHFPRRAWTIWVRSSPPRGHVNNPPTATRIVAAWYFVHQDAATYPATNFDAFNPMNEATNEHVDVQVRMFLAAFRYCLAGTDRTCQSGRSSRARARDRRGQHGPA